MSPPQFSQLVAHYGYMAVFVAIFLASAGAPLPAGELLLYAGALRLKPRVIPGIA